MHKIKIVSEEYKWPPRSVLSFYTTCNEFLFKVADREFDLADGLMMKHPSRRLHLRIKTKSAKWSVWDESSISAIEHLIKYDLNFDGYSVRLTRLSQLGSLCANEFEWRLAIW